MQGNWSLILNILLLIGVIFAITRMIRVRRQTLVTENHRPSVGQVHDDHYDDIISVRKVGVAPSEEPKIQVTESEVHQESKPEPEQKKHSETLMMFILAKDNRQLAGYELLQTLLSSGLRFGEGHLFHRHQHVNGQGPVLCSLAAATPTGVFDLQNIGAFSVRGLCLFMHESGNQTIDAERLSIMLETAQQLSEGLNAHLLDESRQPLTEHSLQNYYRRLRLSDNHDQSETKECASA